MIRTTTFYSVVCDDCGTATSDISEFPAWDDEVYATEEWVSSGGYSGVQDRPVRLARDARREGGA